MFNLKIFHKCQICKINEYIYFNMYFNIRSRHWYFLFCFSSFLLSIPSCIFPFLSFFPNLLSCIFLLPSSYALYSCFLLSKLLNAGLLVVMGHLSILLLLILHKGTPWCINYTRFLMLAISFLPVFLFWDSSGS